MFVKNIAAIATFVATAMAYSGKGTIYQQFGVAGSCGQFHSDSDLIVALPNTFMNHQSGSPYCGRQIRATNVGSNDGVGGAGNTIVATVADTCPGCGPQDVDFSIGGWNALTNSAPWGNFEVQWEFV